jgi:hypothetical protein
MRMCVRLHVLKSCTGGRLAILVQEIAPTCGEYFGCTDAAQANIVPTPWSVSAFFFGK